MLRLSGPSSGCALSQWGRYSKASVLEGNGLRVFLAVCGEPWALAQLKGLWIHTHPHGARAPQWTLVLLHCSTCQPPWSRNEGSGLRTDRAIWRRGPPEDSRLGTWSGDRELLGLRCCIGRLSSPGLQGLQGRFLLLPLVLSPAS